MKSPPSNKESPFDNVITKLFKNSLHIYSEKLTDIFNECLSNSKFPDILKRADITAIFEKGNDNEKGDCHPVSMLSTCTNVFENHYLNKLLIICEISFQSILLVSVKTATCTMF